MMKSIDARYFEASMNALVALAFHGGASAEFIRAVTARAVDRARDRDGISEKHEHRFEFESIEEAAIVLDLWHTSARFTDDRGEPIPLPINGDPPNLECLISAANAKNPESVTSIGKQDFTAIALHYRAISINEDIAIPEARVFKAKGMGSDRVSRLTQYSARFNAECLKLAENTATVGFSRCAYETEFPIESLPWVKAFMEEQGMAFLQLANDRLVSFKPCGSEETTLVAIGCYLHVDDGGEQSVREEGFGSREIPRDKSQAVSS